MTYRNRRRGCVSVKRGSSSVSNRILKPPFSSRAPWNSGQLGWTMLSLKFSNRLKISPASPKLHGSSCSSGPSTGKTFSFSKLCLFRLTLNAFTSVKQNWTLGIRQTLVYTVSSFSYSLQLYGHQRFDPPQRSKFRLFPPDPPALWRIHVLSGGAPCRPGNWRYAHWSYGRG